MRAVGRKARRSHTHRPSKVREPLGAAVRHGRRRGLERQQRPGSVGMASHCRQSHWTKEEFARAPSRATRGGGTLAARSRTQVERRRRAARRGALLLPQYLYLRCEQSQHVFCGGPLGAIAPPWKSGPVAPIVVQGGARVLWPDWRRAPPFRSCGSSLRCPWSPRRPRRVGPRP